MSPVDALRLTNVALALITVWFMCAVTWRNSPRMEWFEVFARMGVVLVFVLNAWGIIASIQGQLPLTVRTIGLTTAFSITALGFYIWALNLPRRDFVKPLVQRFKDAARFRRRSKALEANHD